MGFLIYKGAIADSLSSYAQNPQLLILQGLSITSSKNGFLFFSAFDKSLGFRDYCPGRTVP